MPLAEVDTPALLLDLDAFERNLDRMDAALAGKKIRLRPHAKSHKCPEIALRQLKRGAVGVCCQKVSEAEAMVDGGVPDVLVANEVGFGIVPDNAEARRFRDLQGRLNQRIAAMAGRVVLVVAGIPMLVKGEP